MQKMLLRIGLTLCTKVEDSKVVKFYIVAFIFYSWSGDVPSMKIRADFDFNTYQQCMTVLENFRPQLQESLQKKFNGGDRYSIQCIDGDTLGKIKEKFGYEEERNT